MTAARGALVAIVGGPVYEAEHVAVHGDMVLATARRRIGRRPDGTPYAHGPRRRYAWNARRVESIRWDALDEHDEVAA